MSHLIVTAPWVVPVSQPPVCDGAVVVCEDKIVSVGTRAQALADYSEAEVFSFPDGVICPGLVNAHTHLTLSALAGVVPSQPFEQWLPKLVAALKPWEIADHEASGIVGAEQCLRAGVTVVGDIAYGAAEVARASEAGLGGVYYWELLGLNAEQIDDQLDYLRFPEKPGRYGERVVCGLSPHSPYTSGPELLQGVHRKATALRVPSAVHVAESSAEVELLMSGTGPLAAVARRTAHGFIAPGTSTVRYLANLGVLDDVTAVHLCHASDDDVRVLARHVRGAVTCPRSNRYLHNPPPSPGRLLAAGVVVGVGTDSSASNHDLDLMEEVRVVASMEPAMTSAALLHMATQGGADAIGVGDRFGSLEAGKLADLAVFSADGGDDPAAQLIRGAGVSTARAVMSSGRWRVWDGRLVASDTAAWKRAQDARSRAADALSAVSS